MPPNRKSFLKLIFASVIGIAVFVIAFYIIIRFPTEYFLKSHLRPKAFIDLEEKAIAANKTATTGLAPILSKSPQIRIAIGPIFSPEMSLRLFDGIVKYLGHKLNREAILVQRSTYAETNEVIRNGGCDIAFICSFPFLRGAKDFGLQSVAIPLIDNKQTYYSYIIVPSQSKVRTLLELENLRFASADVFSNTGWVFPANWLKSHGQDPEHFFSEHVITGGHDNAISSVASGIVDGAAGASIVYDQMVYENPSLADRIKVILQSPPYGMPPLVCGVGVDSTFKRDILDALYNMHQDIEGRKALSFLRIQKFAVPPPELFSNVKRAIQEFESAK